MASPAQHGVSLQLAAELRAPASLVFESLTEPDRLARWWGPHGFTAPSIELDLRVGGGYRIAMQPPEGEVFHLEGEFREIDPPRRLAYTFRWDPPDPEDVETVVTLSVLDLGSSSRLVLDQGPFATKPRLALHQQGWTDAFERLEALLTPTGPTITE